MSEILNTDYENKKIDLLRHRKEVKERQQAEQLIQKENERICGMSPIGHVYDNTMSVYYKCVGCGRVTYTEPEDEYEL